jgi:catechol 2,3-dioxygenase-like lactoylglutathione lyase family enzyme
VIKNNLCLLQATGIAHACIVVSDMEKSKRWYQEVLGLKLVGEFKLDTPEIGTGGSQAHTFWGHICSLVTAKVSRRLS